MRKPLLWFPPLGTLRMIGTLAFAGMLTIGCVTPLRAQDPLDGVWQGYDGEWRHVSEQLIALAEATPEKNFAWRPAPGVRSTSEVYMHIVDANFYLLSVTGPKMPADLNEDAEKTVTSKAEVIRWLKRSLRRTWRAKYASKIETRPWTGCICESSSTPTSIWAS
jgi:hypothetical protein